MFTSQQLTGVTADLLAITSKKLILHAKIDRRALEHLVNGADGTHLAAHGAGALSGGRGLLVALLAGDRVESALPHGIPVELAACLAHLAVHVAGVRYLLGDIGGVCGNLSGHEAIEHVLGVGQAQVLGRRHVAQEVGTGAGRDSATDGGGDVVVAHTDIGH